MTYFYVSLTWAEIKNARFQMTNAAEGTSSISPPLHHLLTRKTCWGASQVTRMIKKGLMENASFTKGLELGNGSSHQALSPVWCIRSDQIRSDAQSCPTLCDPMNRSTPGLPVLQLPEFTETQHSLSSPSPLAPNPSQHQSLFQRVNSSPEVAKVLQFQL